MKQPRSTSRVLMTADAVGGVWTYALELAGALRDLDIITTIAVMGPAPADDQLADAARIPDLDVAVGGFRLEWMNDPWDDVEAAGTWLLRLDAQRRPHVVHLNGYSHAVLPFQAPVLVVAHSCVMSWHAAVGGEFDPVALATYHRVVGNALRLAPCVVAPTSAMVDALQRHYGPLGRTVVVPNGRSPDAFAPGDKAAMVFAAGRLWDRAKNVEALRAIARDLSWPVVIAGDHAFGSSRLSQAEMRRQLAAASIVAHPARYEPFGLLPLEAALSGCALVLGDIDSLHEIWGDAALYVSPDDRSQLRTAIETLIASPEMRARLGAQARQRALQHTPARMARQYADLYDALVSSPDRARRLACAL